MNTGIKTYSIKFVFSVTCLLLTACFVWAQPKQKTVLFVCEHGSAKSVVAASHFNKAAKEQGLNVRVISRGTNPDKAIPAKINQLLVQDGFAKKTDAPQKLSADDIRYADYVVAFCALPAPLGRPKYLETWNVPSFEAGYPAARDSILINTERIIQKIKSDVKQ